jgi:tetratricopeptide (TPR) repeat protein
LLEQALGLWHGEPFTTMGTPWLDRIRTGLQAERRAAQLDYNDHKLQLCQHGDLLPALATDAAEHPLNERLAGQLMVALYRSGRQTDALDVYRRTRTALVSELGVEPAPDLRQLHQRILAADPVLTTTRPSPRPTVTPRQLPPDVPQFTGRDGHLNDLHALSAAEPPAVAAINGTAGVGKTALAVHFGHQIADRAVRASFAVSYNALGTSSDPLDQTAARVFRLTGVLDWVHLSVPITAALLDRPHTDAHAALERLVDDHLLDSPSPGRYRTHDLLRLYARDVAEGDEPQHQRHSALRRALACYVAAAEQATRLLDPAMVSRVGENPGPHSGFPLRTPAEASTWIDTEHGNLVAAARQAAAVDAGPDLAVRLTAALHWPLDFRGRRQDQLALRQLGAETALRLHDPHGEALAHEDIGYIYSQMGRMDDAIGVARRALTIWRAVGDHLGEQRCLNLLGLCYRNQQRFDKAIACHRRSGAICRGLGHRSGEASALNGLGLVYQRLRRFDKAFVCHRRTYDIEKDLGHRFGEAVALGNLGWAHQRAGDTRQACAYHERSIAIAQEIGHHYQEAESLWGLGHDHHALGRPGQARTHWRRAISILHDLGELTDDESSDLRRQPVPDTPWVIQYNL